MVPGRWGSSELLSRDGGSGEGLGLWLDLLCAVKHRPKGKGRSEVTGLPLRPQASPLNCSKNGDSNPMKGLDYSPSGWEVGWQRRGLQGKQIVWGSSSLHLWEPCCKMVIGNISMGDSEDRAR